MTKIDELSNLMRMTYDQAVEYLLGKYGKATAPYFVERSYNRFIAGEIKAPAKGKVTRTSEGLYCHHIKENEYSNAANADYIKHQNIPYEIHLPENLVYCNLLEHLVLHLLIYKEHQNHLGIGGIGIMWDAIDDWFLPQYTPQMAWMRNCYDAANMPIEDIHDFLSYYRGTFAELFPIETGDEIQDLINLKAYITVRQRIGIL